MPRRTQKQKQSQRQVVNVTIAAPKAERRRRRRRTRKPTAEDIAAFDYLQPRQLPPTILLQTGDLNIRSQIGGTPSIGPLPISEMPIPSPILAREEFIDIGTIGREGFVEILDLPSKRETLERLATPVAKEERSIPLSPIPMSEPFITPKRPSIDDISEVSMSGGIPLFPSQVIEFNPIPTRKPFRETAMEDVPVIFSSKIPNIESQMWPTGNFDITMTDKPFMEPSTEPIKAPKVSKSKLYYEANRDVILEKAKLRRAEKKQQQLTFSKPKTVTLEDMPKPKKVVKAKTVSPAPFY